MLKDGIGGEMDSYLLKLKEEYGLSRVCKEVTVSSRAYRLQGKNSHYHCCCNACFGCSWFLVLDTGPAVSRIHVKISEHLSQDLEYVASLGVPIEDN